MEDNSIKNSKKRLRNIIGTSKLDDNIKLPLTALADNFFLVDKLITPKVYRDTIFLNIDRISEKLENSNNDVMDMLNEMEDFDIIEAFLSNHDVLECEFEDFYNKELKKLSGEGIIVKLKSAVLYLLSKEELNGCTYQVLWETFINKLVTIIFEVPSNLFIKRVLFRKLLSNDLEESYNYPINKEFYPKIPELLIGSQGNFKFFYIGTSAYKKYLNFKDDPKKRINNPNSSFPNLNLKFTRSRNKNYHSLIEGKDFSITKSYLESIENFFTIGNHELADIQLPIDDKEVSKLTACIFLKENEYFIIDTSKKRLLVSRKIETEKEYKLKEGMVIDLATRHMISINKILKNTDKYNLNSINKDNKDTINTYKNINLINTTKEPYKNDDNQSSIEWEFIKGEYASPLGESRINILKSDDFVNIGSNSIEAKKKDRIFIFGRAGSEECCFRFSDQSISSKHLYFKYYLGTKEWTMYDINAKHGNYLLFKKKNEILDKLVSEPQRFINNESGELFFFEGYFIFTTIVRG